MPSRAWSLVADVVVVAVFVLVIYGGAGSGSGAGCRGRWGRYVSLRLILVLPIAAADVTKALRPGNTLPNTH